MIVIEHRPADGPPSARARTKRLLEGWLHRPGTARLILLLSLMVTGLAWWAARHYAQDDARQRFERRTDDIQARIATRMAAYEAMLRGGVGMVTANPGVTREQWRQYVDTLKLELHYPGIQGFGISRLIQPGELAAHERAVRAEGFPRYEVRPPGPREAYTAIVYLEPFVARNLRAFGYDMLSEPVRREAMLRARDTGHGALSGLVTLVQEDGQDVQKGFLLYLPVYEGGHELDPERLWGWVYAPFRVRDLMNGILGPDHGHIALHLHDGAGGPRETAFYSSRDTAAADEHDFVQERELVVAGRRWTVTYEGRDIDGAADALSTNLIAVLGLAVDLTLYWSIASLARRKRQTEHEVAQRSAEVKARADWLDAVAGLSPDGTLVFERGADGQHRLVFTNPAFSQWFGLEPEDLLGLTEEAVDEWLQGLAPSGRAMPELRRGNAQVELAGPPRRVLKRGQREGDRHRVYYFHDVTHETEVETLKNEFLTTAAHELRTPLASVYGFAELLQDVQLDPARRQRAASIVYRQAAVLKHLVDELLDLARMDSRRGRDFDIQRCDLRRIAEAAAETFERPGEVSRIHVALGPDPVWIDGDATKLQQALVNLLSNALKYSAPPAGVSLSLDVVAGADRRHVALRVVDAGVGMTPEQCRRAFERFYRADPTGQTLGAGLGLAIVKEIVELHKGSVAIHSTIGAGTQVTLRLPLRTGPAPAAPAEAATGVALSQPA